MNLKMIIENIKSIDHLEIDLPTQKGLYAITGANGSGKSTLVTCAASAFFNMQMNEYFGKTEDNARIIFRFGEISKIWSKSEGRWRKKFTGYFHLKASVTS